MQRETTDRLLSIIGSERANHSRDAIVEAEAELRRRSLSDVAALQARVSRAGRISAGIGALFALWGAALAVFGMTVLESPPLRRTSGGLIEQHFPQFYVGAALLQACAGIVLIIGGLQLRQLRERGRRKIVAILWLALAGIVAFYVVWAASLMQFTKGHQVAVVMLFGGLLVSAFWGFLFWLPLRFLRSPRVREVCGEEGALGDAG